MGFRVIILSFPVFVLCCREVKRNGAVQEDGISICVENRWLNLESILAFEYVTPSRNCKIDLLTSNCKFIQSKRKKKRFPSSFCFCSLKSCSAQEVFAKTLNDILYRSMETAILHAKFEKKKGNKTPRSG